ncbi:MAG: type II toxin-antitoxin system RelE/ParE family toxin [Gallionella sp.]|nr:type II toxin-antitoxin system RelE/ParE family toxin [Gallionella sp.]
MRVRWLRGALRNLDQEAIYIARDNPKAAAKLVCHLRDSALLLGEQPNLGRPGRIPGTRELVLSNLPCILPYRVRNDTVEILRVFHTARQWPPKGNEHG